MSTVLAHLATVLTSELVERRVIVVNVSLQTELVLESLGTELTLGRRGCVIFLKIHLDGFLVSSLADCHCGHWGNGRRMFEVE